MSTINNIPFDINRTPMDKNTGVNKTGTVPVHNSDAILPVDKQKQKSDRRSGDDRRKVHKKVTKNRRYLTERRQPLSSEPSTDEKPVAGSIIDLEV